VQTRQRFILNQILLVAAILRWRGPTCAGAAKAARARSTLIRPARARPKPAARAALTGSEATGTGTARPSTRTAEALRAAGAAAAGTATRTKALTARAASTGIHAHRTLAGSASASGAWRHDFVAGQFPITVLIKFLEGGRGIGDFIGVDDAVVIGVKRVEERRLRRTHSRTAGTATGRAALLRATGCAGASGIATRRTVLRQQVHGRQAERQRQCGEDFDFHNCSLVVPVPRFRFQQPW